MIVKPNEYVRDIEESDEVLDFAEGDPVEFWEKKQRELVTSVVDYNLGTLVDLVNTNAINLRPDYQRRFRWDDVRQSKLIESFLMNVPVPPIFLNEDMYGQYSVIDGQQRLTAVREFLRGRLRLRGLEVFADINGSSFDDLPPRLQSVIRTRPTLRAVIILRQSDPDVKFMVFQRLNTGGVQLNAQEIRNSTWPGPLNNMILDLSTHPKFHRLLGISEKERERERSTIYKEMRDAELVLRYFTFRNTWRDFAGGMKRHMDRFMVDNQRMPTHQLEEARQSFLSTLDTVAACFGEHAFQRWRPERGQWRQQVLASLYDAEMFACMEFSAEQVRPKQDQIIEGLRKLFDDAEFRQAIDAGTNAPGSFRTRVEMMQSMLRSVVNTG